jgi:hypothetical protein
LVVVGADNLLLMMVVQVVLVEAHLKVAVLVALVQQGKEITVAAQMLLLQAVAEEVLVLLV